MGQEKLFENKIKGVLKKNEAWFIKYWAGSQFTKNGIPDILSCVNGYFLAIEVKAANGKPSELQLYTVDKINEAGGFAIVLYPKDYETFLDLIYDLRNGYYSGARKLVKMINKGANKNE